MKIRFKIHEELTLTINVCAEGTRLHRTDKGCQYTCRFLFVGSPQNDRNQEAESGGDVRKLGMCK
jgi:hypothetical protein